MSQIHIRHASRSDQDEIRDLAHAAFPTAAEARLIDQLRHDQDAEIELVATIDDVVHGHIVFSRMQAPMRALALAPLMVSRLHRRKGVGASLTRQGLELARAGGWDAIFVLGDPNYYGEFGFKADAATGFISPYAGPYLQALLLTSSAKVKGTIKHASAFGAL